jgi:hypothetical protein
VRALNSSPNGRRYSMDYQLVLRFRVNGPHSPVRVPSPKARTRFVMFYLLNMLLPFDHFKKHSPN